MTDDQVLMCSAGVWSGLACLLLVCVWWPRPPRAVDVRVAPPSWAAPDALRPHLQAFAHCHARASRPTRLDLTIEVARERAVAMWLPESDPADQPVEQCYFQALRELRLADVADGRIDWSVVVRPAVPPP